MMASMYGTINNNNNLGSACTPLGCGKCPGTPTQPEKTKKSDEKSICQWNRTNILFGIFVASYLMFVITGAVIYQILEIPSEQTTMDLMQNARTKFLLKYPQIKEDLTDFEDALKLANGITNYSTYNETYESNWTIGKSLFFVGTLLTTIGYGHVTPQTVAGKVFTIAYATVGIPMTLILLSAFVERLLLVVMTSLLWLKNKLCHICSPLVIKLIHLAVVVFLMVTIFLLIPAIVISRIEPGWDLLDSFYYCFISLTTIGLGDYIPGDSTNQPNRDLYKIAITVYLYAGTTLMMLTLAIFYDIPEINIGRLFTPSDKEEDIETGNISMALAEAERSSRRRTKSEMFQEQNRFSNRTHFGGLDQHMISSKSHVPDIMSSNTLPKDRR